MCAVATVLGTIIFTGGLGFAIASGIAGYPIEGFLIVAIIGLVVRGIAGFASDWSAATSGAKVKAQLRDNVLEQLSPGAVHRRTPAAVATLLGHGIDALDVYFGQYLPQLIATAIVTPITIVALWFIDPLSGLAVTITLPLIPLFMVLIGWATTATQTKQWSMLVSLSNGFADVIDGLSTLQLFGRAERQVSRIRQLTDEYRLRTMAVLRMSFLSGFALEVGASLSVAVVAVSIGLRLVEGSLGLDIGLWALLLAPEAFLALRRVGSLFHASAEGVTAINDVFELIDHEAVIPSNPYRTTDTRSVSLDVREVAVDGRLRATTFTCRPGELLAVHGHSGCGKSSLLEVLRGRLAFTGVVQFGKRALISRDVAWAPQRHSLVTGTVLDNVTLGGQIDWVALDDAMRFANVDLPLGQDVGESGSAISGGQASRISVARAMYRALAHNVPILLLDEPTAALDEHNERHVARSLKELADRGFLVICTTHRPEILAISDRTVELTT